MKIYHYFIIIGYLILSNLGNAQTCETYTDSLFHMLPKDFPKKVNCVDSLGMKQGAWLIYTIRYNPEKILGELEKGYYIDEYSYGYYKDNKKVKGWYVINNVHLIYPSDINYYTYSGDTMFVDLMMPGYRYSLYYNSDSTIIKSSFFKLMEQFPVCITCDANKPKDKECTLSYRNQKISCFAIRYFEIEFYRSQWHNKRDKKAIDLKLDK